MPKDFLYTRTLENGSAATAYAECADALFIAIRDRVRIPAIERQAVSVCGAILFAHDAIGFHALNPQTNVDALARTQVDAIADARSRVYADAVSEVAA